MNIRIITIVLIGVSLVCGTELLAQNSIVSWSSFSMGFGTSAAQSTQLTSAVGQPFVDRTGDGDTQITSGFLSFVIVDFATSVEEPTETGLPRSFELFQNYPNPFNPSTTIAFSLPRKSEVKLRLFDILGREVALLVNEELGAGHHKVIFDATNLSSGVYFYRIEAEGFVKTRKLTLLK